MIKEAHVSFEVAKLLKEKGFDVPLWFYYDQNKEIIFSICWSGREEDWNNCLINNEPSPFISAPTHQMAMKWLREIYNKHCDIGYDVDLKWFFQIIDLKETVEYDYPETKYYHAENEIGFNTYEETVEAVLKYSLENLI